MMMGIERELQEQPVSGVLGDDMILVPILLRADGITVRVHFPANLTEAEADKIARVVKAYATTGDKLDVC